MNLKRSLMVAVVLLATQNNIFAMDAQGNSIEAILAQGAHAQTIATRAEILRVFIARTKEATDNAQEVAAATRRIADEFVAHLEKVANNVKAGAISKSQARDSANALVPTLQQAVAAASTAKDRAEHEANFIVSVFFTVSTNQNFRQEDLDHIESIAKLAHEASHNAETASTYANCLLDVLPMCNAINDHTKV